MSRKQRGDKQGKAKDNDFWRLSFYLPHPVKELAEFGKDAGAKIVYDGAHVLGLIAGKTFQDPLREGADVITASTHKTFPGPQGGIILSNMEKEDWKKVQNAVFPGLVSNHHLHRLPALAITLMEMLSFGKDYAGQIVKNAKMLAKKLDSGGFKVLWKERGYTQSHQIVADTRSQGGGKWVAEALEKANIIINKNLLPWDDVNNPADPSGVRIGVQEMTRFGMKENEMNKIGDFISRVCMKKEDPAQVGKEVSEFRKGFTEVKYALK